ncbi:MAG: TrmH family RNA methyltransferase [Bacteroidota bacterium]
MDQTKLIEHLSNHVTNQRLAQFTKVLSQRTRYITVALEDIYQSQNASAVLRTMDCFGIQDVHIIENSNEYQINPDVTLGSSKWLSINRYNKQQNNTKVAIRSLKEKNYRIIATTPHTNEVELKDFNIQEGKVALFFGAEKRGISDVVMDNADEFLKIPMYGFTESYNISVSAAISLYHISSVLRNSKIPWQLSKKEKDDLLLEWLKKSIKKSDLIVKDFLSKKKNI